MDSTHNYSVIARNVCVIPCVAQDHLAFFFEAENRSKLARHIEGLWSSVQKGCSSLGCPEKGSKSGSNHTRLAKEEEKTENLDQ